MQLGGEGEGVSGCREGLVGVGRGLVGGGAIDKMGGQRRSTKRYSRSVDWSRRNRKFYLLGHTKSDFVHFSKVSPCVDTVTCI